MGSTFETLVIMRGCTKKLECECTQRTHAHLNFVTEHRSNILLKWFDFNLGYKALFTIDRDGCCSIFNLKLPRHYEKIVIDLVKNAEKQIRFSNIYSSNIQMIMTIEHLEMCA